MKLIAKKGGSQLIHIYVYYRTLAAEETILSFKNAEILKNYFRSKTQFL
jgi:hypothetical protein